VMEPRPPGSRWSPSVVIQGKVYHFVGPLQANTGNYDRMITYKHSGSIFKNQNIIKL
jgi:hypothetical protein